MKLPQFSKVAYGNTSGGGLVALSFDMADVTVADETQAKERRGEKTRRPRGKDKDKPGEKSAAEKPAEKAGDDPQ